MDKKVDAAFGESKIDHHSEESQEEFQHSLKLGISSDHSSSVLDPQGIYDPPDSPEKCVHKKLVPNTGEHTLVQLDSDAEEMQAKFGQEFHISDFVDLQTMDYPNGRCLMGEAFIKDTGEAVVLKFLSTNEVHEHNLKELQLFAQIPLHENVLNLLGTLTLDDKIALVSLRQQSDLLDWVRTRKCESREYDDISYQMGSGLAHLHQHDIIHRDVALRNFLIKELGDGINIKICDFGLSRAVPSDGVYTFDPLQTAIAYQHCSYEVLAWATFEVQSDVYSFGISIWELFKRGEEPFGHSGRVQLKNDLQVCDSAADLLDMSEIPSEIQLLIKCCTKIRIDQRPMMCDVLVYFQRVRAAHLDLETIPQYFHRAIQRSHDHGLSLPQLKQKDDANDEKLNIFFKRLFNPKDDDIAQDDVDQYVNMCSGIGLYRKSKLSQYLLDCDAEDLVDDCFILKRAHFRNLVRELFESQEYDEVKRKMKEVLVLQDEVKDVNSNQWDEKDEHSRTIKVVVTSIEGELPESVKEKQLLAIAIRQSAKNVDVRTRVIEMCKGSIKVTLAMNSEHLTRFKNLLDDKSSNLNSPGNIYAGATILESRSFYCEDFSTLQLVTVCLYIEEMFIYFPKLPYKDPNFGESTSVSKLKDPA